VSTAWGIFESDGQSFDLGHLDEKVIVVGIGDVDHRILVRFSDHCFTENAVENDQRPVFAESTRSDGRFCLERYNASLSIWEHLERALRSRLWLGEHDRYLMVSVNVGEGENLRHYIIALTLERLKGRADARLLMRVRTAFLRTPDKHIATFGEVRFTNLVTLTLRGKSPPRIYSEKRKKPW
jgi:hypothetical protein